uniref:JmjC domain-containing protein n=1 Tax=Lygus hesperus TaxID=30085 RepID=A0A0A9WR48_LYGHE
MKAVRVPYEESSVYSMYNFFRGCGEFPPVKDAIMVDLDPGDVLYVPNGWWHYVENLSSAISVNTWIPLESDDESRFKESLVKYFVHSTLKDMDKSEAELLLNPNEDDLSTIPQLQLLQELNWLAALRASPFGGCSPLSRPSSIPATNDL